MVYAQGKPFIYQGRDMLIQRDAQPESSRWQKRNAQPHRNQVLQFENIESNIALSPDLEPQYEVSGSSLHHPEPEPTQSRNLLLELGLWVNSVTARLGVLLLPLERFRLSVSLDQYEMTL
ncbi:hypothetical protein J1N35_028422, partial [Gossypium stocksii]